MEHNTEAFERLQHLVTLHRTTIQVLAGQQKQLESLYRLVQHQQAAILLLSGGEPEDAPKVQELSKRAAREIRELEALFAKEPHEGTDKA